MRLSVIVPCHNEADNLPSLVERVGRVLGAIEGPAELVLVDDGSRDQTLRTMTELAAAHSFVATAHHPRNRGVAAAWATGLATSRGDTVCLLDADLQYRPEEIPRLLSTMERGAHDLVQGWRSHRQREGGMRWVVSRGLNTVLNTAFAMDLPDNKSGFLLCKREVLADLLADREAFRYFQILIMVAARHRGYSVGLVETPFDPRTRGDSSFGSIPVMVSLRALVDVARGLRQYRRLRRSGP